MTVNFRTGLAVRTLGILATVALFLLSPMLMESLFSSFGQSQKVLVPDNRDMTLEQIRSLPEDKWLDMDQARQITNVDSSKKIDVWLKAERIQP